MNRQTTTSNWTAAQKFVFRLLFVFVLSFIITVPFPHSYLPDTGKYTSAFFEKIAKWLGVNVFNIRYNFSARLISDSTGLYIHTFFIGLVSIVAALVWGTVNRHRRNYAELRYWFVVAISYYLTLQLMIYGFSKIFKAQFYLPEPNTLYTVLGNIPRDLAYWSVMGASRMYSIFLGCAEVFAALLLLFRRTRVLGALAAAVIVLNIVMINFSFDISVKLYSIFLLLVCMIIAWPGISMLIHYIISGNLRNKTIWKPIYRSRGKLIIYRVAKILVIVLLIADVLTAYIETGNFNDDKVERPMFHGAYKVDMVSTNSDSTQSQVADSMQWKRIFVHRAGYFIREGMNGEMQDYLLEYDTLHRTLILRDYDDSTVGSLRYHVLNDSTLRLDGLFYKDTIQLHLNRLPLEKLPLLNKQFHWTIDE